MKKFWLIALVALCTLAPVFAGGSSEESQIVSTDGSTSMESVIGSLAEAFMMEHPEISVTYNPTGSGSGITAVSEGRCDIGLASRSLKDDEIAGGLTETVLALDGIAIIVNNENPVNDLTLDQIAAIYTGEISNWSEVGGNDGPIVLMLQFSTVHTLCSARSYSQQEQVSLSVKQHRCSSTTSQARMQMRSSQVQALFQ